MVTQHSVEGPYCNQQQFNSGWLCRISPEIPPKSRTQCWRKKKRNTTQKIWLFVGKFLPSEQDKCGGTQLVVCHVDKTKNILLFKNKTQHHRQHSAKNIQSLEFVVKVESKSNVLYLKVTVYPWSFLWQAKVNGKSESETHWHVNGKGESEWKKWKWISLACQSVLDVDTHQGADEVFCFFADVVPVRRVELKLSWKRTISSNSSKTVQNDIEDQPLRIWAKRFASFSS